MGRRAEGQLNHARMPQVQGDEGGAVFTVSRTPKRAMVVDRLKLRREVDVDTSLYTPDGGDVHAWQVGGVCREMDSSFFFPESEHHPLRAAFTAAAKAMCGRCPALLSCREHGLTANEPYGIWGGLTVHERRKILHARHHTTTPTSPTAT